MIHPERADWPSFWQEQRNRREACPKEICAFPVLSASGISLPLSLPLSPFCVSNSASALHDTTPCNPALRSERRKDKRTTWLRHAFPMLLLFESEVSLCAVGMKARREEKRQALLFSVPLSSFAPGPSTSTYLNLSRMIRSQDNKGWNRCHRAQLLQTFPRRTRYRKVVFSVFSFRGLSPSVSMRRK